MAPGLFRAPEMTLSQFYLDQGVCPSSNTKLSSLLLLYNVLKSSRVISSNFISFNIILATLFPLSFHINFRISLSISLVYPKSCYGFYLYYVESSNSWHVCVCVCVCVWVAQSCLTLCDAVDCSPPDSSVHGILQPRILQWVAISSFRGSSWPRYQTCVSCIGRQILYHGATREAHNIVYLSIYLGRLWFPSLAFCSFYCIDPIHVC